MRIVYARLLAALLAVAACSVDNQPGSGLLVQVDSDLATPKDLDRVQVVITQSGETLLDQSYAIGSNEEPPPLAIPLVFRGDTAPAHIDAVGYRLGQARVERTAVSSIPTSRWAMLRLRLDYLCLGRLGAAGGEDCGADLTCVQGACAAASFEEAELPDFREPNGKTAMSAQPVGCFDTVACFANASEALLRDDCSFEVNSELASDQLNVALRLPRGGVGTCGEGACFVPFDQGGEGYSFEPGVVHLPPALCERTHSADGAGSMTVVFSNSCPTKTADNPLCDETSQGTDADATGMSVITGVPGSSVGPACDGARIKSCGMCGTQERSCVDGTWGDFGECGSEGECAQNQTRACGGGGEQTCGGDCRWGDCLGQVCRGAASQACARCGTQERSCENGIWAQWGECSEQRACSPGETQSCGSPSAQGGQGTQACGGNCEWGPCNDQRCAGAPSEACGMCGSRSRECNGSSGEWSEFGACSGEGTCEPNDTRSCGQGGTQVCGGNCEWSSQCTGQTCEGERSTACGNCGTRTRTCNTNNGSWSEWSACSDQGDCSPDEARGCGRGGTQVCNGSCRWDSECTGQSCVGAGEQACGNCGTQTRSCNGANGTWSDWSSCRAQGECRANSVRSCGSSGSQECGSNCRWDSDCSDQMCPGDKSRACGNCGVQRRSCDSSTGRLLDWGPCEEQGRCSADAKRDCGSQGTQACGDNCQWQTLCSGQVCAEPDQRACGNCGLQTSTCDTNTGRANWSTCRGEGQCAPGSTQKCGSMGVQECGNDCRWAASCSMQVCAARDKPAPQSCERCGTREAMCDSSSGKWVLPMQCSNQGACMPGQTRECGPNNAGTSACGDNCQWGDCALACAAPLTRSCGNCMTGTQRGRCDPKTGMVNFDGAACMGGGECKAGDPQMCTVEGRTGSRTCTAQCSWPQACSFECSEPPTTGCGNKCGVRSGACDTASGQRACVEAPDACEPTMTRACSDERGSGTQRCGNGCTWGTCTITMPRCNGSANERCGFCDQGRRSETCDASGDRPCEGVPSSACDPTRGERDCRTSDGRAGKQTCSASTCELSSCEPTAPLCNGSANERCGFCDQGRRSETCDASGDRPCEGVPSSACDPTRGERDCRTSDGRAGKQTCSASTCELSSCEPTAPLCNGSANERCGFCDQGRRSETCDASGDRPCEGVPSSACDPTRGERDCRTSDGRAGKQTCSASTCELSSCEPTAPLCNGSANERCGFCDQGRRSETCDASGDRPCEGVPSSLCDPNSGERNCTTNDGRAGKQTCSSSSCMLTNCVADAPLCKGDAGDRCGDCNMGSATASCNPSTGERGCDLPDSVCTAQRAGGACEPLGGGTGHTVCTPGCDFECQPDIIIVQ